VQKELLLKALDKAGQNKSEAARELARLSQLGLEFGQNENSCIAKWCAMNTSLSKTGENGL